MRNSDSRVTNAVLDALQDITGVPSEQIRMNDRLVGDLRMNGDDFTFVFVPRIEQSLGIVTNPEAWQEVSTVQDAIKIFRAVGL